MVRQTLRQFPSEAAPLLVGRERELVVLRDHLTAALAGRGSLVLIGGEAGIGKTALAEAVVAEAAGQGALVLIGRCYDLAETPPYGPWAEALTRAPGGDELPALPTAVLPPEREGEALASQEAIIRRVVAYLGALAARRPLMLLLEDLHWADPASLDLLRVVGRGLTDLPVLLLATYRDDEVAPDHPLAARLPAIVRETRAARLELRPLDGGAIGALVAARYAPDDRDRARLVRYLTGRSDGNALFLSELLRTLEGEGLLRRETNRWVVGELEAAPVPTLLRQVIDGRVARLPPATARLLAVAAVLGQEVPLALWASVAGVAETLDGAGVRFTHALVREAIYEGSLALRRRTLHRQAADVLAATPHPNSDAVAYHFQRAGETRAVEWLIRAGQRARAGGADLTAAARFVAAAGLLAGDTTRDNARGGLLLLSGFLLTFVGTDAALRHLAEAEALARSTSDPGLAAYVRATRSVVLCHRSQDIRAGVAELEQAVAAIEALPHEYRRWNNDQVALARVGVLLPENERVALPAHARPLPAALVHRGSLANWYGWTGRYREALAEGEATVAAALADDPSEQNTAGSFGLAHASGALGHPAKARHQYARWRATFYANSNPYGVEYNLFAELQHVVMPYQADDPVERSRLAEESARAWARVQDTVVTTPYPSQAGLPVALVEGRWATPRARARRSACWHAGRATPIPPGRGCASYTRRDRTRNRAAASSSPDARSRRSPPISRSTRAIWRPQSSGSRRTGAGSPGAARCSGGPSTCCSGRDMRGRLAIWRRPAPMPRARLRTPRSHASPSRCSPPTARSANSPPTRGTTLTQPRTWPPRWRWPMPAPRPTSAPSR
jgi:hypothetical protein